MAVFQLHFHWFQLYSYCDNVFCSCVPSIKDEIPLTNIKYAFSYSFHKIEIRAMLSSQSHTQL